MHISPSAAQLVLGVQDGFISGGDLYQQDSGALTPIIHDGSSRLVPNEPDGLQMSGGSGESRGNCDLQQDVEDQQPSCIRQGDEKEVQFSQFTLYPSTLRGTFSFSIGNLDFVDILANPTLGDFSFSLSAARFISHSISRQTALLWLVFHSNFMADTLAIRVRTFAILLIRVSIARRNNVVAHISRHLIWSPDSVKFRFYSWKTQRHTLRKYSN
jgi:hypothetical protein